jgi:hypothetical protein
MKCRQGPETRNVYKVFVGKHTSRLIALQYICFPMLEVYQQKDKFAAVRSEGMGACI